MKTILWALIFLFIGILVHAQITTEAFLKKAPALPKDSCGFTKESMILIQK